MTEQKGVGVNSDTMQVVAKALVEYYNFLLTGQGFEELVSRMVIMKETGFIGSPIAYTDLLIAVTMFHVTTVVDIESKAGQSPEQVIVMRQRTIDAFAASLNGNPIAQG